MSEKNAKLQTTKLLDNIEKQINDVMAAIMADTKLSADIKAARVGLASTALHHIKLLKGAIG